MKTWLLTLFFSLFLASAASAAGNCNTVAVNTPNKFFTQGGQAVVDLVCKIHTELYKIIEVSKKSTNAENKGQKSGQDMLPLLLTIFGYITMVVVIYGMIIMTFQIIEVVMRLGVYGAFSPLFLYAYIYPSTRPIFDTAVKGFIYAFFKFALLGLFCGATLIIIKIAIESVGGFYSSFGAEINSNTIARAVAYAAASIACAMMIAKMMGAASSIAAALTQYSYANIGIASGASSGVSMMGKTTMIAAMPVVGVAAGAVTGLVSKGAIATFMGMSSTAKASFLAGLGTAIAQNKFSGTSMEEQKALINNLMTKSQNDSAAETGQKPALPHQQQAPTSDQKVNNINR